MLNSIFTALGNVMHAFLLFFILMSIYSVIAVSIFYGGDDADASQAQAAVAGFSSFTSSFFTLLGAPFRRPPRMGMRARAQGTHTYRTCAGTRRQLPAKCCVTWCRNVHG